MPRFAASTAREIEPRSCSAAAPTSSVRDVTSRRSGAERSKSLGPVRLRAFIALALALGALLVAAPAQAAGPIARRRLPGGASGARASTAARSTASTAPGTQRAVMPVPAQARPPRGRHRRAADAARARALGRPLLGRRVLVQGRVGFDVSQLQFLLAWHGFPSGTFDGGFGARTDRALAAVPALGAARRGRRRRARHVRRAPGPSPALAAPARPPAPDGVGDRFGPRGHASTPASTSRRGPEPASRRPAPAASPLRAGCRRLRLPRLDRARTRGQDDVRAPLADRRAASARASRAGLDRARRLDGPFDRAAPPLRGARPRRRGRPASRLRLAPSSASWPPGSRSGTRLGRRPARARGSPRSSSRPAT